MIVLGFAVPGWFPLLWGAFVPVLTAVSGTTARGAMFLGMLLGGLTAFAGHVWSWFGTSCEPWMHLILASLRLIETRRGMMHQHGNQRVHRSRGADPAEVGGSHRYRRSALDPGPLDDAVSQVWKLVGRDVFVNQSGRICHSRLWTPLHASPGEFRRINTEAAEPGIGVGLRQNVW